MAGLDASAGERLCVGDLDGLVETELFNRPSSRRNFTAKASLSFWVVLDDVALLA